MTGEMYPGGPVELPCPISIGGTVYVAERMVAARSAWYIATAQWAEFVTDLLGEEAWAGLYARLRDPIDDLDVPDIGRAGVTLAIRLSGMGDGIAAWRKTMHLTGALLHRWHDLVGSLLARGIDPSTDQLWRVLAGVYGLTVAHPEAPREKRMEVLRNILEPLPHEPWFLDGAGAPVTDPVLADYDAEQFKRAAAQFESGGG